MAVKYGKFELPESIAVENETSTFARFIAEPFEQGFGHTVGNCLRRVMLSSLEAPAIMSIRIEGVAHEYQAIDGVIEDTIDIILNLKGALIRKAEGAQEGRVGEQRILSKSLEITADEIASKGQRGVTLGDVIDSNLYEVINPELVLFNVTKPMQLRIDLRIGVGRGYVPAERFEIPDKLMDEIVIDGLFSPVRLVSYHVENTRVGKHTDYDKVILEVTTDGRVSPREALSYAAQIANRHLQVFHQVESSEVNFAAEEIVTDGNREELMQKLALGIGEIELSVRSTNCLNGAGIKYMGELVIMREQEMLQFRNFGKKSLSEIKDKLHEHELSFGMDLAEYGITRDNIRKLLEEYREERQVVTEPPVA